ncbi:CoA transferase [Actinomadura sp. B10D3]|uniref:CaiB/BaiF CoA transferase family protein n=1 Tax=Actinomadura sp. B10D3 TaxID=3153557 RepID=UPI00325DF122
MSTTTGDGRQLDGVVVLDLSRALAGPYATMMLGDLGARVIKVEAPGTGDDTRGWGPPFVGEAAARESTYFLSCNRNKESIILDLKDDADKEMLSRLARRADVLVENFRPGTLDRLGLSVRRLRQLNPRLIILSITGFGHDGPEAGRAGYDQIAQGEAGLMSLTGPDPGHPTRIGIPIADLLAGMHGAYGVVSALYERQRTGRPRIVRTSLLAAVVATHAFQGTRWTVAGEVPAAQGNHHPSIAPYGLFHCADGMLQIAVGSEGLWRSFAAGFDIAPMDARFATNALRVANRGELTSVINAAFAGLKLEDVLRHLDDLGIPAGEVRTLDRVYEWEQTRSQGLLIDVEHPSLGAIALPGPALRFDDGFRDDHSAPPTLGQHDAAVRAWLDEQDAPRTAGTGGAAEETA